MTRRRPVVEHRRSRGRSRENDLAAAAVAATNAAAVMVMILEATTVMRPPTVILFLRNLLCEVAKALVARIGATSAGLILANEAARHLPAFRKATDDARAEADAVFSKEAA